MSRRTPGASGAVALSASGAVALSAALLSAALLAGPVAAPAGAAEPRSAGVADRAVAFIASQQRPDGGFGAAEEGFAGFETPDAVLAIAEAAQATLVYDPDAARAAVRAIRHSGNDGLHYLDDLADSTDTGGISAGKAAQLILVAAAVGLDPAAFDPDGDGARDLVAAMDAGGQADGSYGTFNDSLQVLMTMAVLGRPAPPATVDHVLGAQQANGGFTFSGDPAGSDEDVDTTSRAVQALVAAGQDPASRPLRRALSFLAQRHNDDGSWSSFGSPDPNSTAMAALAVTAAGYHLERDCWRLAHGRTTSGYVTPAEFLRSRQAGDGRIASPNDEFGVNTFATSQAVQALVATFQPVRVAPRQPCPTTGYRLVAADGGVFSYGDATFHGSTGHLRLNQPIVASAATPSGHGYWLFAADGGVFSFGDAQFAGSTGDMRLSRPIVAAAATPSGGGYWLFAADGGVFAFGDAAFSGSTGAIVLNSPVVGADATASGRGYRLFAGDGGVFTFGDATFEGSTGAVTLRQPVVAAASSRQGRGYWLFAADGGVFSFGDAGYAGSAGQLTLSSPVVSGMRSRGDGYYLVAGDGGIFAFGDAPFLGSRGGQALNAPITTALL